MSYDRKWVDYAQLKKGLLLDYESYLKQWLPDGKGCNNEYIVKNSIRLNRKVSLLKINIKTGTWSDLPVGKSGGDPISLYAYLHKITYKQAAYQLTNNGNIANLKFLYTKNKKKVVGSQNLSK